MEAFKQLLLDYGHTADRDERKDIESQIWTTFGTEAAVLVLDMSGFSLLTQKHGIIHYLSLVRRMHVTVEPIAERHGGQVVKFEADNGFLRFNTVADAISAAIEMNQAFADENTETPDMLDIRISCGIDFGEILLIEGRDFFGNAVNRASKLGEDIAEPGEILVTREAMETTGDEGRFPSDEVPYTISGISIEVHRIAY